MNIMLYLPKRKDVQTEMLHELKQCAQGAYVKVILKKSTTSEATELGVLRVCQLVLFLATRIG